jgi:hypothetical protein
MRFIIIIIEREGERERERESGCAYFESVLSGWYIDGCQIDKRIELGAGVVLEKPEDW